MESAYYIIENHLPLDTWPLLLLIFLFLLGVCIRKSRTSCMSSRKAVLIPLLITYTAAILFATLISRTPAISSDGTYIHKAEWIPLWSWYEVIVNHSKSLFGEILLNAVLFVPVGVLIALLYQIKPVYAFMIGFIFSAIIETTQFITCRGLFEWDDMLHNGLGCLMGYGIGKAADRVWSSHYHK